MNVFRPSRQYRRQFSGQPCPACGNRVDPKDLVAFAPGGGQTFYLHESCIQVAEELAQMEAAAGSTLEEEAGEPTATEPMVHDGTRGETL